MWWYSSRTPLIAAGESRAFAVSFLILTALTVAIWGLESMFEYAYDVIWRNLAQSIQMDLRIDAYAHLQNLDMA